MSTAYCLVLLPTGLTPYRFFRLQHGAEQLHGRELLVTAYMWV